MDYGQHAQLAEMLPKFKGLLTSLLADSFFEEEYLEPLPENFDDVDCKKSLAKKLGSFIKPFT